MSGLEQSIRKYVEEPTKGVIRPGLGLSFDSLGEAYDFYNLYSWEIGFGIKYGKSRLNAERTKCMQEIVCGCSVSSESRIVLCFRVLVGVLNMRFVWTTWASQRRRIADLAGASV